MLPIRDHNPSNRVPFVTYALIVVNVAVFLTYWPLFSDPRALAAFYGQWGLIPARASDAPLGFLTAMFLHGGLMHLGGNMLFLWIFGDNMEDEMGPVGFLVFYLASGVGASLIQVISEPVSRVPVIGASGAIAGVMGGYLLLFPKAKVDILLILIIIFRIFPVPAWIMLGLWFGMQLLGGFGSAPGEGGVAYWAHAGGFVVGLGLTVPLWLKLGGRRFWDRTHGHPPHPEARYRFQRSRVPRVRR